MVTLDENVEDFELLVAQVPLLTEEQYMGFFLRGLKEELKWEVVVL